MDRELIIKEQLEALLDFVEFELGLIDDLNDNTLALLKNHRTRQILKETMNRKYGMVL